jgi:hypothetical protein
MHEELVARLERERISYPDELEAERYMPGAVERVAGVPVRYTPMAELRAVRNRERLAQAAKEIDGRGRTTGQDND